MWHEITQLRADLATLRAKYDRDLSNAEVAHQMALATVTAEREDLHRQMVSACDDLCAERAAHAEAKEELLSELEGKAALVDGLAETRRQLDQAHNSIRALALDLAHRSAELTETRKALVRCSDNCKAEYAANAVDLARMRTERDSTRAELAKSEARVKKADPILVRALGLCEKLDAPSSVACDIERALEALRG